MRIVYVCLDPGIPVFGTKGASVHIQADVRQLLARGHRVTVHASRRGEVVPDDLKDLEIVEIPVPSTGATADRELAQQRASDLVAQRLIADPPDMVYERYSLFSTVLAQVTAAAGCPGALEVNSPLITEQTIHRVLVDAPAAEAALRAQVHAARSVVCVSDPVSDWVLRCTGTRHACTVPNGVDLERITPQPEDPEKVVVTFVGTLKPWHGVSDLLEAAARARVPWQVRVIGDGPCRVALEAQANRLGVDVDFRGAVEPWRMPRELAGSAIGVAPYPDLGGDDRQYFSPLKVYEYLAAGLPVVGTAVGQLPRLLDGVGVLVPPSDPVALGAAIDELAGDSQRRAELGELARARAVERHGWDRVVDTILDSMGMNDETP